MWTDWFSLPWKIVHYLEYSHQVCQRPNIWHLAYQTPKKLLSWDVSNVIIFTTHEQYHSIFETVWIKMLKIYIYIIHFLSLTFWLFFFSLFLFLLSFSATPFFSVNSLPFLFFSLLQSPKSSPLPSFLFLFFLFFSFFPSLRTSVSFFFPLSHSLFLLFSLPRPLPLRLAVAVEFGLTDEVNWWR